jgi:hypothetical protein
MQLPSKVVLLWMFSVTEEKQENKTQAIAEKKVAIAEKEAAYAQRYAAIMERDAAFTALENARDERNHGWQAYKAQLAQMDGSWEKLC